MEKTAAQEIAYLQVLFTFTSGKIVCPDLWDFTPNRTSLELKWYKVELSPPLCAKPSPHLSAKVHTSPPSVSPEHHLVKVMSTAYYTGNSGADVHILGKVLWGGLSTG